MKEDDPTTNQSTPSNTKLDFKTHKNTTKVSKKTKAEAYKLKKWRNQVTTITGEHQ